MFNNSLRPLLFEPYPSIQTCRNSIPFDHISADSGPNVQSQITACHSLNTPTERPTPYEAPQYPSCLHRLPLRPTGPTAGQEIKARARRGTYQVPFRTLRAPGRSPRWQVAQTLIITINPSLFIVSKVHKPNPSLELSKCRAKAVIHPQNRPRTFTRKATRFALRYPDQQAA